MNHMTFKLAITFLSLLLLTPSTPVRDSARTPEQLIQELAAAAKSGDTDAFLSHLTDESRRAVDEWLKNQLNLRQAQEDFLKALDERFPESRPKVIPPSRDLKHVLGRISSMELVSKKEGPGDTMELRVKTSSQIPGGRTICHEDTFLTRKENGGWKLKIDPGPLDRMLAKKAALERLTAAVRNQEFRDRRSALLELNRVQFLEVLSKPESGIARGAKNPSRGRLHPQGPTAPDSVISVHPSRRAVHP